MNEVFRLTSTIKTNGKTAVAEFKAAEAAGKTAGARLGSAFKTLAKVMKVVFIVGAAAATYAMGKFFTSSIKSAAEYEQKMAMVKSVTGATGKEFEALGKKAKELGKTTKFTMTDIAEGMENLGRAGLTANEIIDSMAGVTALAASQSIELGEAAEMTAGALNGFNLEADQAGRVADVYAYAASNSAIRTQDLAETFKYAMPAANALGYSIEDVAGMTMLLGDNMVKGSMAGTSLNFAFSELVAMSDEFKKKLGEVGVSVSDLTRPDGKLLSMAEILGVLKAKGLDAGDMFELFGKRAGKGMAILLDKGEAAIKDYTDALEECGGTAEEMAEIQLDTLSGQVEILRGSWELLKVTVGEKLMPILKNFLKETIIPLVNKMVDWAKNSDTLEKGFKRFIDGVKNGLNWVVDNRRKVVTAITAIGAAFALWMAFTHPILTLLTALTALGIKFAVTAGQAGVVVKEVKTFGEQMKYLIDMIDIAGNKTEALNQFISAYTKSLGEATSEMVEAGTVGKDAYNAIAVELAELRDQMGTLKSEEVAGAWISGVDAILAKHAEMYPELEKLRVGYLDAEKVATEELEKTRTEELERMHAQGVRWAEGMMSRALAVAAAQKKVTDAYKAVGEETQKRLDQYAELRVALDLSEEGTIEYANAVQDLQKFYDELGGYQDYFVENNMEVDESILNLMADIEELGVITKKTVGLMQQLTGEGKTLWQSFTGTLKALNTGLRKETLEEWKGIYEGIKGFLTSIFTDTCDMFEKNRQAREDYEEAINDIHQDYADKAIETDENRVKRLKEINEEEAESLEDLRDDYEENLDDIRDISEQMTDLQGDRLKGLAKQQESYIDKIADLERNLQHSRLDDEERFGEAREDVTTDYNRSIEDENTRYGRQLADLEEEIAKAGEDRLQDLLDRKEELTEDHGERLADIELRKTRRMEDIQTDAARAEADRIQEEAWRREEIETDHKDRLEEIEKSYAEHVAELYKERDAKLEQAEKDFQERRTEIVDTARKDREQIEADYNTALAEAQVERDRLLNEEATAYEEQRKTVWGILKQGVHDFIKAIREKFVAIAAEQAALGIIAALTGNLIAAGAHALAALKAGAVAAGLAVLGFAKGVLAFGPTLGVIGEGPYKEAVVPLSPPILADIGKGIVDALAGARYEPALAGAGGLQGSQTIEVHVAEGAVFNIREEADIEKIAKELGDEFEDRIIGVGRVTS